MMSLDEIRKKLEDRNLPVVAERIGVSYRTILNIKNGSNKNPSHKVVEALIRYFEENN